MSLPKFLVLTFILALLLSGIVSAASLGMTGILALLPGIVSAAPLKLRGTSDPANHAAQNSFVRQLVDPISAMYGTPTVVKGPPVHTTSSSTSSVSSPFSVGARAVPTRASGDEAKPRISLPADVVSSLLAAEMPILPRLMTLYKGGVPIKTIPEDSVLTVGPKRSASPSVFDAIPKTTSLSLVERKPFPGLPSDGQLSLGAPPSITSWSLGEGEPFPGLPSKGQVSFRAEPTPTPLSQVNFEVVDKRSAAVATKTLPDGEEVMVATIHLIGRATTMVTVTSSALNPSRTATIATTTVTPTSSTASPPGKKSIWDYGLGSLGSTAVNAYLAGGKRV